MTGTIVALTSASRTGCIQVPDGSRLAFRAEAVLGDFDTLAVGHRVSFDIEHDGARRLAIRVFHEPVGRTVPVKRTPIEPDLRYGGFRQVANVRTYRFDAVTSGSFVQHSILLDTTLLLKYHVGVQEIPALCLRKVTADIKASPQSVSHELDDGDLGELAASRVKVQRKPPKHFFAGRRGAPPPIPAPKRTP
jgi:cold shock CspA family protein